MIDIDVAIRLRDAGLRWEPRDGDHFTIDAELLRDDVFMLATMVVEAGVDRHGGNVFRFNGTTEWALDSIQQEEAIWIPREDQLRDALGEQFVALRREEDDAFVVEVRPGGGKKRDVRAPRAEDAYAGALLVHLTEAA